ncbi:hypothetical protein QC762_0103040 [Podospora pseudocomata]|uniref:Uncharacterized protein n=1 Tax=Podospora pseudocomata TaxID=2093779 RepID=A0ABR0G9K9_9PEZI|nr:hypothetical protein QC762_0103040 [Podospora pseudocomata]
MTTVPHGGKDSKVKWIRLSGRECLRVQPIVVELYIQRQTTMHVGQTLGSTPNTAHVLSPGFGP